MRISNGYFICEVYTHPHGYSTNEREKIIIIIGTQRRNVILKGNAIIYFHIPPT